MSTETTTIDLGGYFDKYGLATTSQQPSIISQTAIINYQKYDIDVSEWTEDFTLSIVDKPDTLSMKLYGTPEYWWVNLVINSISYYDFPLSDNSINSLASHLYGENMEYSIETYRELIGMENEKRRKIKIIKNESLPEFLRALETNV